MTRVAVFIDGRNFYYSLRYFYNRPWLDFTKLSEGLCGPARRIVWVGYYTAQLRLQDDPQEYAEQRRQFAELKSKGIEVHALRLVDRTRKHRCSNCSHLDRYPAREEKGVDVKIATDMLMAAFHDEYDVAVLVTHDGDLAPAVPAIEKLGKRVENADFWRKRRSAISRACGRTITLNERLILPCLST